MIGQPANRLENLVLVTLAANPDGLTGHELVQAIQLPYESVTPRIRPLVRKGKLVDSGLTRQGVSGRSAIVWKLAQ